MTDSIFIRQQADQLVQETGLDDDGIHSLYVFTRKFNVDLPTIVEKFKLIRTAKILQTISRDIYVDDTIILFLAVLLIHSETNKDIHKFVIQISNEYRDLYLRLRGLLDLGASDSPFQQLEDKLETLNNRIQPAAV